MSDLIAVCPYERFPSAILLSLVQVITEHLSNNPHQHVSVSALHCIGALFSNASALGVVSADDKPSATAARGASSSLALSAEALADGSHHSIKIINTLLQFGSRATLSSALRAEVLSVLAKAARQHPIQVASTWEASSSHMIMDAFSDPSAPLRSAALRVVEELLRCRADVLGAAYGIQVGGVASSGVTQADGAAHDDDDVHDGGETSGADGYHRSAAASPAAVMFWSSFASQSARSTARGALPAPLPTQLPAAQSTASVSAARPLLTVNSLLRFFLTRAVQDTSASVRAAAIGCMSHMLPSDWNSVLYPEEVSSWTTACLASATTPVPALPTAIMRAVAFRNDTLTALLRVRSDAVASARVSLCRLLGTYLTQAAWRTAEFCRLAAVILLQLMNDDSISVRSKASWALGNLCSPAEPLPSSTLATKLLGSTSNAAPTPGAFPTGFLARRITAASGADASSSAWSAMQAHSLQPLYPTTYERAALMTEPSASAVPLVPAIPFSPLLPPACDAVLEQLRSEESSATAEAGTVLPPMHLYAPDASQSELVNLLTLPVVRMVAKAALLASMDVDKVACTAVRALGFCVQALVHIQHEGV
ncbi:MAG: hypothetical protein EOO65_02545, partial [Methanosarcinales archaeon]